MRIILKEEAIKCGFNDNVLYRRNRADEILNHIAIEYSDKMMKGEIVIVDFKGIELLSASFFDELFFKNDGEGAKGLYRQIIEKENIVLLLDAIEEECYENLYYSMKSIQKIRKEKLDLLLENGGDYKFLLADQEDEVRIRTFELVKKSKMTARALADIENIQINTANNRLSRLYKSGFIFRSEASEEDGKSYTFFL